MKGFFGLFRSDESRFLDTLRGLSQEEVYDAVERYAAHRYPGKGVMELLRSRNELFLSWVTQTIRVRVRREDLDLDLIRQALAGTRSQKYSALELIAGFRLEQFGDQALKLLGNWSPDVREGAVFVAGALKDKRALPTLRSMAKHEDISVRISAEHVLMEFQDPNDEKKQTGLK